MARVSRFLFALSLSALALECNDASPHSAADAGAGETSVVVEDAGSGGASTADAGTADAGATEADAGAGGTLEARVDGGLQLDLDASLPPPELTEQAACGVGTAVASLRSLNLLVMFDRSGSMVTTSSVDPITGLNRWQTATSGLVSFFGDPHAAGLGVALRFFPDDYGVGRCTNGACDAVACSEVRVELGTLTAEPAPADAQEAALIDAVSLSAPASDSFLAGGTPISAALDGALRWASAQKRAHADQETVVILVTDGEPLGCAEDFDDISALASDALAAAGVSTYAIGLADSLGNGLNTAHMDQLAKAGGTERAFFINDGPLAASALVDLFSAIRGKSLPCDFPIPEATDEGKPVDPALLNLNFTGADGAQAGFTKVSNAAHCGKALSWYYDDEALPTRISLCPKACALASAEAHAKVEILVGCKPNLEVPR